VLLAPNMILVGIFAEICPLADRTALVAAAVEEAWASRTFSVKTSDESGGREATRRFKL
jgi:hypothetical protein